MIHARILAATLFGALALAVQAQPQGGGAGEPRKGPPPEAVEACSGKAAGAACSFMGREGRQVSGTCFSPPPKGDAPQGQSGPQSKGAPHMACRPEHPVGSQHAPTGVK